MSSTQRLPSMPSLDDAGQFPSRGRRRLTLRVVAEGDAETRDSWSGSTHSLILALRALGHHVSTVDVASSRVEDWFSKLVTFAPSRSWWAARHHYGPVGFAARSKRARRASLGAQSETVIQIGATFDATTSGSATPVCCYCDANALFAARGGAFSPVRALRSSEFAAMVARERSVYRRAAAVFAMSECLRRSFIEDYGLSPDRVVTVPAGPNMRVFPGEQELDEFRADAPTILFVGRQFERKGGPLLLDAFRRVRASIPEARLVIAGCVPAFEPQPGVTVLGPLKADGSGPGSLTMAYREAHVFCMPSRYEPFGVVFIEAMMHGLPCVGANAWAMPELIDSERSGWLAPPDDAETLARILINALSDLSRLRTLGQHARRRARELFTWERAATIMEDALETLGGLR